MDSHLSTEKIANFFCWGSFLTPETAQQQGKEKKDLEQSLEQAFPFGEQGLLCHLESYSENAASGQLFHTKWWAGATYFAGGTVQTGA